MDGKIKIGECTPDNLVYDSTFPLDTATFVYAGLADLGVLPRGTVVSKTGKRWPGTMADPPAGILAEPLDTAVAGAIGVMYRSGHFNSNALSWGIAGDMIPDGKAELQRLGLYISAAMR